MSTKDEACRRVVRAVKDVAYQCLDDGACCLAQGYSCDDYVRGTHSLPCPNALEEVMYTFGELLHDVGIESLADLCEFLMG
jgi:hypothetical protein